MLTAGILASAVAGLGAAAFFAGGEQQAPGPKVTPAVGTFLVQHAIVTGDLPLTPSSRTAAHPGGTPSAAPATRAGRVTVGVSASGVSGAAAAGAAAAAAAAARAGRRQSTTGRSASSRSASSRSASGRSASGRLAVGRAAEMVRRGLQPPLPAVTATVSVSATASPGP
jgi:hypothetical protein